MRQPPQSSRVIMVITIVSLATSFIGYGIAVFGQALAIAGFFTNVDWRWASLPAPMKST